MNQITEYQRSLLATEIYATLIAMPDMGLGEIGECKDTADTITQEWVKKAGLDVVEEDNRQDPKVIVGRITDFVNSFSIKQDEFNAAMANEHRTLQQSFTRLCLKWIEHCAKPEYRTDGRNAQSQAISQRIVEQFKKNNEGFSPSEYLGYI